MDVTRDDTQLPMPELAGGEIQHLQDIMYGNASPKLIN